MPAYSLNPHANEALYQQLYRHLREDISSGRLATGQRLPSKRRLSADLGISVVTVETALGQLAAEGWVKAKPRSGYYVCRIETANMPGAGEADAQALSHYTRPQPAAVSKQAAFPQLFTYDLAANKVSAETFPLKQWTRTVRAVMAQEPEDELIEAGDPCGSPLLRQAIASHLQDTRDLFVDPDRIVVGEVRGGEALDLLEAWFTGHPGGCSTVHSNSAVDTLLRLQNMTARVSKNPQQDTIVRAVNIIVYLKYTGVTRKIEQIISVDGFDANKHAYLYHEIK